MAIWFDFSLGLPPAWMGLDWIRSPATRHEQRQYRAMSVIRQDATLQCAYRLRI